MTKSLVWFTWNLEDQLLAFQLCKISLSHTYNVYVTVFGFLLLVPERYAPMYINNQTTDSLRATYVMFQKSIYLSALATKSQNTTAILGSASPTSVEYGCLG